MSVHFPSGPNNSGKRIGDRAKTFYLPRNWNRRKSSKRRTPKNAFSRENKSSLSIRSVAQSFSTRGRFGTNGAPASVVELARALKHNVDLVYEWVYSNVDFVPSWGSFKGALGTLIDGSGNSFDQSKLMVELLRESGYTADYVFGEIRLSRTQIQNLLGTDDSTVSTATENFLDNSQIPYDINYSSGAINFVDLGHVWVRATINGTDYEFDPSLKTYTYTNAINLGDAIDFSLSTLRTDCTSSPAVVQPTYIQYFKTNVLENFFEGYGTDLVEWIRTNSFAASMKDIIGGKVISSPNEAPLRQTQLPYQSPGTTPIVWTEIDNAYRATFGVILDTIEEELFADEIYGKRLSLSFNGSDEAELRLDGSLIATSAALVPAQQYPIQFTITQPAEGDIGEQTWGQSIYGNGVYFLCTSWGPASQAMVDYHRQILKQNVFAGGNSDDEDVLGESLAVMFFMKRAQADQLANMYNQLATVHHFVYNIAGIVGYSDEQQAPYFDLAGSSLVVCSRDGDAGMEARVYAATNLLSFGLEASIVEQNFAVTGINAMRVIKAAIADGQKVFDGTSSTWSSVNPQLSNWADGVDPLMDAQIGEGSRLIVHANGSTSIDEFTGGAWPEITSTGQINNWVRGALSSMALKTDSSKTTALTLSLDPHRVVYFEIDAEAWGPPISTCNYTQYPSKLLYFGMCYFDEQPEFLLVNWNPPCGLQQQILVNPSNLIWYVLNPDNPYRLLAQVPGSFKLKIFELNRSNVSTGSPVSKLAVNAGSSAAPDATTTDDNGPAHPPCSCDPISLFRGDYLYDHADITVGSGGFPYSLAFQRKYNSSARLVDGVLGLGWSHNFDTNLSVASNGLRSLGELSPMEAAAAIAHSWVMLQILQDWPTSTLTDILIATMSTQWLMEQLSENAISVDDGANSRSFIKLVDGTYNPQMGYAETIIDNLDGTFTVESAQKLQWNFNDDGKLATFVDPAGVTVTLGYDGSNRVTSVTNGMARTLTLAYTGARLTSVSDGNGRSVSFTVDGSANLTTFTDAESNDTTYGYIAPGVMEEIFLPANPTTPFVVNEYDSLNRIKAQTPSNEGKSNYFFSGPRAEIVDPYGNSRVMYYNQLGSLLRDIDEGGNETVFERDGLNREIKITYPEGNSVEREYDHNNNVLTITAIPKPGSSLANITFEFEYNAYWNKVSLAIDGEGNETSFEYDGVPGAGQGTLLKITRPEIDSQTPEITFTYNGRGQMLTKSEKVTQPELPDPPTYLVERFDYDETSEVLLEYHLDPDGEDITVEFGYTAAGDVNSVTDPRGNETTFDFDDERRMTKRTECAPFGFETNFIHNENGELTTLQRQTGEVDPEFQEWTWTRNVHGDVVTITDPAGKELNFELDEIRRVVSRTDAEGRVWRFFYDPDSRIITVIDPMGETSEARTYTENGMLATITDARNNTTEMEFDGFDRLSKRIYPDSTFEQFGYNFNSQVLTMLTRKGDTITNTFDALTRLATRDPGSLPTQSMAYDLTSRLLSVSTPAVEGDPSSGLFSFGYDTAGRLISQSSPTGEDPPEYRVVGYVLDKNGNRVKLIWPDTYFAFYTFDELNRLTGIKLNTDDPGDPAAIEIVYDNLSRRETLTYLNGCEATYGFAINNDLTSLEHAFVGSSVTFAYSFNFVHQVTEQDISDAAFLWKPTALSITTYAPANNLNQYPSVAGNACTYDDNGNLTAGPFTSATFDVINRVTQIVSGGTTNNYWNDPLNRQSQKEVDSTKSGFLYDGVQLIAEYNSGGSLVNRYIPGARLDEILVQIAGGTTTYLHQDRLGSNVAQTNTSGAVLNKYQYSPFGETPSLAGAAFGFTGQRYDAEIGQYNYKLRQYSPGVGRFLQPDPIGYLAGDMNLYAYVGNDPINQTDPIGLFFIRSTDSAYQASLAAALSNIGSHGGALRDLVERLQNSPIPVQIHAHPCGCSNKAPETIGHPDGNIVDPDSGQTYHGYIEILWTPNQGATAFQPGQGTIFMPPTELLLHELSHARDMTTYRNGLVRGNIPGGYHPGTGNPLPEQSALNYENLWRTQQGLSGLRWLYGPVNLRPQK